MAKRLTSVEDSFGAEDGVVASRSSVNYYCGSRAMQTVRGERCWKIDDVCAGGSLPRSRELFPENVGSQLSDL